MATATAERPKLKEGHLGTLAGTGKLLRFQLRRTRVYMFGWFAGILGLNWSVVAGFPELYPDAADRAEFAVTIDTPAMRSMTGPSVYIEHYGDSVAVMYAHQMVFWSTLVAAVMFILLVTRLTRADEETSRLEVIRSEPVGRRADLAAAMLLSVIAATALGLLLGLIVSGMPGADFGGSMLYGLGHTVVGIFFAAATAVAAQVASYSSTSNAFGFAALAFGALMSMAGSAQDSAALWLSPFGWAQLTYAFTPDERWTSLVVGVVASVLLVWLAFGLVARRDFGQGLVAGRAGRSRAKPGLNSSWSLTWRLSRGMLWAAVITMILVGFAYGPLLGGADDMLDSLSETQRKVFEQNSEASVTDNFTVVIAKISAYIATIFGLLVIGRARKEETGGRGELLAAAPVTRSGWPGTYYVAAQAIATLGTILCAVVLGLVGAQSLSDGSWVGTYVAAQLVYLPAVWIMVALSFAVLGWLPRAGWLRWLPWAYVFLAGYFGNLLELPQWALNISPFEHAPSYPIDDMTWTPLIVLTAIAAAITAWAYAGVRRRDLQFS